MLLKIELWAEPRVWAPVKPGTLLASGTIKTEFGTALNESS